MDTPFAIEATDLVKTYGTGPTAVRALDHASLGIRRGRFTAIMGPSGSGKSTMMHAMAGLDTVDSGSILLGGVELVGMTERERTLLRRTRVGFIFQQYNLVPALTAEENIALPDEPTGALDSHSSRALLAFLRRAANEFGQTIVMVTHDASAAGHADRVEFLLDGRVVDGHDNPTAATVLASMARFDAAREEVAA